MNFLSPYIEKTICRVWSSCSIDDQVLSNNGMLNLSYIYSLVSECPADENTFFKEVVNHLDPVFVTVKKYMVKLSPHEFEERYSSLLHWTGNEKVFIRCFLLLQDANFDSTLPLLLLTSSLERALGDVFLIKGSACPFLLRDLLSTAELNEILGIEVVTLLRIIMGSPISYNIRNVLWHGFPVPNQVPKEFAYFLLLLSINIGDKLSSDAIPHRPPIVLSKVWHFLEINPAFGNALPIDIVYSIISQSEFTVRVMEPFINLVFMLYNEKSYGESLVMLLPLLEHALRVRFAMENECEERIMTAESTEFYTTMDEIMAKEISDVKTNRIPEVLGVNIMHYLKDIFEYPEGPRIRDRISHGEVDLDHVSQETINIVLNIYLSISISYVEKRDPIHQVKSVIELNRDIENYSLTFHPVSLFKYEINQLYSALSALKNIERPNETDPEYTELGICWNDDSDIYLHVTNSKISKYFICDNCKEFLRPFSDNCCANHHTESIEEESKIREDSSTINLLRTIISNASDICDNIKYSTQLRHSQWESHSMRSRQRKNYARMLQTIPVVLFGVRLVLLTMIIIVKAADTCKQNGRLKFLKYILKYFENVAVFTSLSKNKWEESSQISWKLIAQCEEYFGDS